MHDEGFADFIPFLSIIGDGDEIFCFDKNNEIVLLDCYTTGEVTHIEGNFSDCLMKQIEELEERKNKKIRGEDKMNRNYTINYWFAYDDNSEQCVYADTLIIFSRLLLDEIIQIFNELKDIFPSAIGREPDFLQEAFLIGSGGEIIPGAELFSDDYFIYYCWWD